MSNGCKYLTVGGWEISFRVSMARQAILILGMHRSGTSALTGALASLGLQLPRRMLGAAPCNPKGYFEPIEIAAIHDRLLAALGSSWYGQEELPARRFQSATASGFADELLSALTIDYPGATPFIMKDPRLCRLMPLWRTVLSRSGVKAQFVLPIRPPIEVARSLHKRDGLPLEYGCLLWLRHVLNAERETRGSQRVFVHYHELLRKPAATVEAVAKALGIREALPGGSNAAAIDSFIDPGLRHFDGDIDEVDSQSMLGRWLDAAYRAHQLLIANPNAEAGLRLLDRLRRKTNTG
jgi:hypothetical protein